jgi:outer membrane protein assembly factor BamB
MFYMNGVVYYSGGGDGHLHAVDVQTGKHIWRLDSPEKSSSAFFYAAVAGIPGKDGKKGTILAHTGLHVLAYEAAR